VVPAQEYCNGLPNISARFKPDCTSFDVFADLLVWSAQESGTENWAEVITGGSGVPEICDIRDVGFGWDPGFRIGLGYGLMHDQWDTQLYYTWYNTTGSDHVASAPGSVFSAYLGNFYVNNPTGAGIKGVAYQNASIRWKIDFNMFDWELGRAYWVSKALSLRPFLGLKGGWIHQSVHSKWQFPTLTTGTAFTTGTENLKNDFWGLGPSGGIDMKWNFLALNRHSFSLLGDFSGAIMYGHWTFDDVYINDIQQKIIATLSDNNSAASMLRTFMGFGWDINSRCDRYQFSTRLGYEMQFWLDQLQLYVFDTGRLDNELTLQGGTIEFNLDF